ncbi:hypothetical protein RY27_22485 [Litorilinea aerophila]|nr:hypothetical protein RY27_22485 [Litorilinea aerophila]
MDAGLHAVGGDGMVQAVGQAEIGAIQRFPVQELGVVGVDGRRVSQLLVEQLGQLLGILHVGVADGGDLKAAQPPLLQVLHGQNVAPGDAATADEGQA